MTAVDVMRLRFVVVGPTGDSGDSGDSGVFVAPSSLVDDLVTYIVYLMD